MAKPITIPEPADYAAMDSLQLQQEYSKLLYGGGFSQAASDFVNALFAQLASCEQRSKGVNPKIMDPNRIPPQPKQPNPGDEFDGLDD